MARRWAGLLGLLLCLVACSPTPQQLPSPAPSPAPSRATDEDFEPVLPADGQTADSGGATLEQNGVRVEVPARAVPDGQTATVKVGEDIGRIDGRFTSELAGRPVSVDHGQPLTAALTVSWQAPALTADQRASVVLARWDAEAHAWKATTVRPRWSGDTLSADITQFSVWDWFANIGQGAGSLTGSRVDAPSCNGKDLPGWVRQTVDPDEDLSAAAVRVCFEADKDEVVTVRVANNRTFSQMMTMTQGDQRWAWTWPGDGHGIADIVVYPSAHDVLDSGTRLVLPPLSTQAVGVGRPEESGSHFISAETAVSWESVLVDVTSYGVSQLPIGGTDNPALNAFLQVIFECGGKQAADVGGAKDVALSVVDTVGSCAKEILEPDSEFGIRFEELSRKAIAKGGLSSTAAVQANRMAYQAANLFRIIEAGKLVFYASDQFASALVKPLSWSIRGNGRQPILGDWTANCNSFGDDSNLLYRNVALRDEFSSTAKELWQFEGLPSAAKAAVKPLKRCSTRYLAGLAAFLPDDWADTKAAGIVSAALLDGMPDASASALDTAVAPAMCEYGSHRMVDGQVPGELIAPGTIALKSKYEDGLKPMKADLDGDGNKELVATFTCGQGGVNWPEVIGVYGLGTELIGSVDLLDHVEMEHSTISSMRLVGNGLDVRWTSYLGAGFDMQDWSGTLQLRNGKVRLVDVRRR